MRSNSKLACESRPMSDVSQVRTEFSTILVSDGFARKRAHDTFQTIVQYHADQMLNMDRNFPYCRDVKTSTCAAHYLKLLRNICPCRRSSGQLPLSFYTRCLVSISEGACVAANSCVTYLCLELVSADVGSKRHERQVSIHAQTTIPRMFQEHAVIRASMPKP